jgi:hypothetical protein
MSSPDLDTPYWSQDAAVLSAASGSRPGGLSSEEAVTKLRLTGPNSKAEPTIAARMTESPGTDDILR